MSVDERSHASAPSVLLATAESVAESLKTYGPWVTYARLVALEDAHPGDPHIRGYAEIIRGVVVRDFLAEGRGLEGTPKLSAEFLSDYGRFDLSAKEGYLVSLIDGRLSVQRLVSVSPIDAFTTIFYLAKLRQQKVITL